MENLTVAQMTGQNSAGKVAVYKLNEVKMSGDDGSYSLREVLGVKGEDGKYPVKVLGDTVPAVILKMRWRLTRYEEDKATGKGKMWMTSEYDNKNTDKVVLFTNMEKGLAAALKEKYALGSQRVIYAYLPTLKEIVRIIVKASALSGEKNPNGEMGLFEYVDTFTETETYINDYVTTFGSAYREDKVNKRKSYYATTFTQNRPLTEEEKEKVLGMIKEVHSKTSENKKFADEYVAPEIATEAASEEISPDDIPF